MKEYIEKLMNENDEEIQRLQNKISYLLNELEKQNEIIEKIQRNTERDENIFSPRTAKTVNDENMKIEKCRGESIKQEIDYVSGKIEKLFEKKKEYENILGEINNRIIDEKKKETDISDDKQDAENTKEINRRTDDSNKKQDDDEIKEKSIEMQEQNNQESEENMRESVENEKKQNELEKNSIKLIEKLLEVSKSVDLALALLNGDKNKCKNELKKIKRTLKICIEEIK